MGYTHYWKRPKELDAKRFAAFRHDAILIMIHPKVTGLLSCNEYKTDPKTGKEVEDGGPPRIWTEKVWFNGRGSDAHETFGIERVTQRDPDEYSAREQNAKNRELIFEFCKTAQKPYDTAVVACLLAFKHHFGDAIVVDSDGDWKDDWEEGRQLYEAIFPQRKIVCPFEERP